MLALSRRLESARQRSKYLERLLVLSQVLTTEATKDDWPRRVASRVVKAVGCNWAAFCVAGREVDRIILHRRHGRAPEVTIRPAGFLRRAAGEAWSGCLPLQMRAARFGLPDESCWYLPVQWKQRVYGTLVLSAKGLGHPASCPDRNELLATLAHQVALAADLSELHDKVVQAATFDRMTGAHNRGAWLERAEQRLEAVRHDQRKAALLLCDLDNFKVINDSLGHAVGDDYLIECAAAMTTVLRSADLLGRLGGDEFVIWMEGLDRNVLAGVVERLLTRVSAVSSRFQKRLKADSVLLGISMGVVAVDRNERGQVDQLLEKADAALYEAKAAGRGTWRLARGGSGGNAVA